MKNIKITIEYDGTNYHGWQSQLNGVTIQDTIANAIFKFTNEEVKLVGCSRTDVGVHALEYIANFKTESSIPPDRFCFAINKYLPDDIVVKKSELVNEDFHARFSSKGKKYRYLIYNSKFPSPIMRNRAFHVPYELDFQRMKEAAIKFIGSYDFKTFMATGSSANNTVKNIINTNLYREKDIIIFEITGDSFLYNMVRIIVGTVIDVGIGKIKVNNIDRIIESCDRKMAGKTAPAHGLYLVEVYF